MQVKVAGTGSVSISGIVASCSSDDVGGGSFVDVSSLGVEGSFVLSNLVFGTDSTENKAGTEKTGHSMFIRTAADKRGLVNETSVVGSGLSLPSGSVFTAAELELWSFSEKNGLSGGIAYLFNIYEGGTLIEDDANGIDHALCGHPHLPCRSLSSSLSNLKGESMAVLLSGDLNLDLTATSTKDSSISPRTDDTHSISITEQVNNSGRGAIKIECADLVTAESLIVKAEFTDCESTNENGESDIEKKGCSTSDLFRAAFRLNVALLWSRVSRRELRMTDNEDATGGVHVTLFDAVGAIGETTNDCVSSVADISSGEIDCEREYRDVGSTTSFDVGI
ncbi:hypothetical protein BLNAU_2505 [Blattamonas nauphoetae]|uniref:Uncharacterized protein n=1 Tax=Blattamonas nauphoetae TaxID=2049346 RepID=A0ABQ9YFX1_9EUKA|nr:hypothetical protein BLNAU_2505 [Blattamonas nauphoetae]